MCDQPGLALYTSAFEKQWTGYIPECSHSVIQTDFGLTISYDWEQKLVITLTKNFAGKIYGLSGNFNGNPNDDFTTPTGT